MAVAWSLPGDHTREPVTAYNLRYTRIGADGTVESTWTVMEGVGRAGFLQQVLIGLTGDTQYDVQVQGVNIWGAGEWSLPVTALTQPAIVPDAPTGLTAGLVPSEAKVELSWAAPASSGGATITGYRIELSQDEGNSWAEVFTTSSVTTYIDDGTDSHGPQFEIGNWPSYRVAAINQVGTGPFSEPVASGDPLLIKFDTNRNGTIERSEVISAIRRYLDGEVGVTRAEVIGVIRLYLDG